MIFLQFIAFSIKKYLHLGHQCTSAGKVLFVCPHFIGGSLLVWAMPGFKPLLCVCSINNPVIMTTFDFSIKFVFSYLEYNKREKIKSVKGGTNGGGVIGYLGQEPKFGCFFYLSLCLLKSFLDFTYKFI